MINKGLTSEQEDLVLDSYREFKQEQDDGDFETWCDENFKELSREFCGDNKEEFNDFCKESWKEVNEK